MKRNKTRRLLLVAVILLCFALIGGAFGKYLTRIPVSGKVTFTAKLAEKVTLREHLVSQDKSGRYTLSNSPTNHNEYLLLPGLDIPKDPWITIEGKTPLKSYLFLEVVETADVSVSQGSDTDSVITYSLTNNWLKLDNVSGKQGGTVYVYATGGKAKPLDQTDAPKFEVNILEPLKDGEPETIRVSQKLVTEGTAETDVLEFHAYLVEIFRENDVEKTPEEVFAYHTTTTP